ncbi:MAG: 5-formyltetrahydrofolate cyclo-ligase [Myxococcota bacterium]
MTAALPPSCGSLPDKATLRQELRAALRLLTPSERLARSSKLCEHLLRTPALVRAQRVALYRAMGQEASLEPLIPVLRDAGVALWLPRVRDDQSLDFLPWPADAPLAPGPFGILEPVVAGQPARAGEIDCFLVPGLAFDRQGGRLGRGKGYYDRALSLFPDSVPRVGVAFALQLLPEVPCESWDLRMHTLVSEVGVLDCVPASLLGSA